jgi:hypothetical protein
LYVKFSFTENSATSEIKSSFVKEKDLKKQIEIFNKEVVEKWKNENDKNNNFWYFGIDRGNQELATLGIVKWTKEEYDVMLSAGEVIQRKSPEFPEIEVYKIKNLEDTKEIINDVKGTKITVKISDNPS